MSLIVFLGPTLPVEEARELLDASYRSPVAQGDVLRAARERPRAIGIVDGYFERVPAVWHKEILWAMSHGIHVFGAASIGALRAAELCDFGMVGVGRVFEDFRSGVLEADDEVAVTHAPPEHGFRPFSEAMVNIRATLSAAVQASVIGADTRAGLEIRAKAMFYPERTFVTLLREGERLGLPAVELRALAEWLPRGRVDQKRLDAREMLLAIGKRAPAGVAPKRVAYRFEHTDAWEAACRQADEQPAPPSTPR